MFTESRVVVRVPAHVVVVDPPRRIIEVRRSGASWTPDDTLLGIFQFDAVSKVLLFVKSDGAHRLLLAIGRRTAIDLGSGTTRAQTVQQGRQLARLFGVALDVEGGDHLDVFAEGCGPIVHRIKSGREVIEAELVDPVDPRDELSPWISEVSDITTAYADVTYESPDPDRGRSVEDLLIHIEADPSDAYDDGPFALPRVRTAPEVEAVCPSAIPVDPPPMRPEAEATVRASHRPPREIRLKRESRFDWLRAALKDALGT